MGERKTPMVLWSQRQHCLYLTIEVADCDSPSIALEPEGRFLFEGHSKDTDDVFELELDLYSRVCPEMSQISSGTGKRNIFLVISKEDASMWPRLTSAAKTPTFLKVDWNKWVDEDDECDADLVDTSELQMCDISEVNTLQGGYGSTSGNGSTDSDDEELPELEPGPPVLKV
mmetsp:Transcript_7796/g.14737  ORF Transcript_7796/g.14737 Transcript_7796/m.14737 type:complete len:172 (-) Transcript_7796:360-875(-)|eukprot:CAMPEP_0114225790 /NCGR_PEP_ID=MMETSP0058-20121206/866_1 /TAXON_ID=36894 /ORGANISM="Pyramimonas parkeae, CCMP726" /LENGTH=171 /DNA_ID=CAMNT_0001336431 /DNA_START=202 /DNA_END=717 /DNA_ORIENTATION=+